MPLFKKVKEEYRKIPVPKKDQLKEETFREPDDEDEEEEEEEEPEKNYEDEEEEEELETQKNKKPQKLSVNEHWKVVSIPVQVNQIIIDEKGKELSIPEAIVRLHNNK